jgi:hypothetical protein
MMLDRAQIEPLALSGASHAHESNGAVTGDSRHSAQLSASRNCFLMMCLSISNGHAMIVDKCHLFAKPILSPPS